MGTMLQIRIDEDLKNQASSVFESLGIDLSTAVINTNVAMFALLKEGSTP